MRQIGCWYGAGSCLGLLVLLLALPASEAGDSLGPDPKEVQALIDKAAAFLKSRQGADGGFSPKIAGPGVSAVIAAGLLRNHFSPDDPVVAGTLGFMEK